MNTEARIAQLAARDPDAHPATASRRACGSSRTHAPAMVTLLAHGWGNLGDHAITHSTEAFLAARFGQFPRWVFTRQEVASHWGLLRQALRPTDVIILPGGGNMGDVWLHEEVARRRVVQAFPKNRIISFPQSIHFQDEAELATSAEVYRGHRHLLLATRDDRSFDIAQSTFRTSGTGGIVRTDDIVTGYEFPFAFRQDTADVVFIERDDLERAAGPALSRIHDIVDPKYPVRSADTIVDGPLHPLDAPPAVYRVADELHSARLVVSDRLHGALLALAAGVPVIAVDNSYGKVSGALGAYANRFPERLIVATHGAGNITEESIARLYAGQRPQTPFAAASVSARHELANKILNFLSRSRSELSLSPEWRSSPVRSPFS